MPEPDWKAALRSDLAWKAHVFDGLVDEAMETVTPHIDAAYQRGLTAGQSQAGYRLVQENERLRRELELAHQSKRREAICPTCLSALSATESAASAGDP
jgi:hypothetical protein